MSSVPQFQNEFRFVFFTPPHLYDATIAFYRDTLGFPINGGFGSSASEMRGSYVQAAKGIFEIISDPTEGDFFRAALEPGEAFQPAQGGYFLIEVENVDEMVERLSGSGAALTGSAKDWPWGFREFRVQDPCGNVICLFSRR